MTSTRLSFLEAGARVDELTSSAVGGLGEGPNDRPALGRLTHSVANGVLRPWPWAANDP